MKSRLLTFLLIATVAPSLHRKLGAQEAPAFTTIVPSPRQSFVEPLTGYPVTGRMICADTQRAARFAQVTLIPARDDGGRRLSGRTDLDGNFTVFNVPAGDYYLTGALTGYVNQIQLVQSTLNAGADPGSALAGVPLLHVSAGGAAAALSLQRGAVLAGTVQWDDGTPAVGVSVSAQPATAANSTGAVQLSTGGRPFGPGAFGGGYSGGQTDDRGRFRLSGLAPGSYYVRANLQAPVPQRSDGRNFARTLSLSVYAPDKVRRTEATPVSVTAGEERVDLSLILGLAGMHTISGTVSSSAATIHSGSASLTDQTDSTLNRNGVINSDGSFTIPYVPPGTYTLRITASSQGATTGRGSASMDSGVQFQPLQESVTVTDSDLTGLALTVMQTTASH